MHWRKQGMLEQAVAKLPELLQDHPTEGSVLVEGIKLMLLHQEFDGAYSLYLRLKTLPDAGQFWDIEGLLRLQLATRQEIPEIELTKINGAADWVTLYQADGSDPLYPVKLVDYKVICNRGPVTYFFAANCPACNSTYQFSVRMTLLIDREFLCPACLARQQVDFDIIKPFLEKRFATGNSTNLSINELDKVMHTMKAQLTADALAGERFPLICRYLNIDYLYVLNQFVLEQFCSGSERAAS